MALAWAACRSHAPLSRIGANGALTKALTIKVDRASEAAQKLVRDVGGSVEVLAPAESAKAAPADAAGQDAGAAPADAETPDAPAAGDSETES